MGVAGRNRRPRGPALQEGALFPRQAVKLVNELPFQLHVGPKSANGFVVTIAHTQGSMLGVPVLQEDVQSGEAAFRPPTLAATAGAAKRRANGGDGALETIVWAPAVRPLKRHDGVLHHRFACRA